MRTITPQPVTEPDCELGEGPVWHDQTLTWVDIPAGRIHHADANLHRLPPTLLDRPVGAVVPTTTGDGWLAAAGQGFVRVTADGTVEQLAQPEAGNGDVRMNDGKCDPHGRFWAGSMSSQHSNAGSLYRLDGDGSVHRMLRGIGISNGLGWSPDEREMYHVDSAAGTLTAFDYDPDAPPRRRRIVKTFTKPIAPDGLCVDDSGAIWLALWDGAAVHRYTPDGRLDAIVTMPVDRPTSCCFADDTLYITTARTDRPEPLAGAVFACPAGITGPAAVPYQRA